MIEKECPKCKELMSLKGKFTNEVILNVNEYGEPDYFEEEVEEYRSLKYPDKIFWRCGICDYEKGEDIQG